MNDHWFELLKQYPDTDIQLETTEFSTLTALLRQRQSNSIVIFTGRRSADITGAWSALSSAMQSIKTECSRFSDIEPEPSVDTVVKMINFLEQKKPSEVIALGGGSIIDAAKAAWASYQTQLPVEKLFGSNLISAHSKHTLQRIIAIPTTAGTGSEVTPYSNIVNHQTQVKQLISDPAIIPQYALLCPEFTKFMPRHVTLATACDAMAHALEGFVNIGLDNTHPQANSWAMASMRAIKEFLPPVLAQPDDMTAREALAIAACLGGMVIRYKSTGLPHLCSFSWFERIEHGIAVAIMVPYALQYYIQSEPVKRRVMELASLFPGESPMAVIRGYRRFLDSCGVPNALKAFPDIDQELLEKTAGSAASNRMKLELAPKPVPLEQSYTILNDILQNAYNGTITAEETT